MPNSPQAAEAGATAPERKCSVCSSSYGPQGFSKKQWGLKAHSRKCKGCLQGGGADATAELAPPGGSEKQKGDEEAVFKGKGGGTKGVAALGSKLDREARAVLEKQLAADGDLENEEDDPFVCDVTGALISMVRDGRYHFDDGRGPEDPSAVCMSVQAYSAFASLSAQHSDTWEEEYADKTKWVFIPPEA